ncbi:TetR/AcrR family transcriptional regulator [Cryobacterium sp. PAMC25264]|uniref:TetR/AcrR family transcriptional regulator n=1 Tax=Cryobacterium sp. PAMC25264 TaxID=2861288 RepID=UPI001C63381A|nr:TetR/AcrR family transcriptional regulator [Cryobacterium sp. PAMC25264]QYF72742.1 TetR/AcrR family transcriptional regulator [Cryobacterium sp. PAMC25264]
MTTGGGDSPVRTSYRHGDLRRALIEAGVDLAREGGPPAVVLREATRRVGVTPNAAYRHFADRQALLDAVCSSCQGLVAGAIEIDQARVDTTDPVDGARLRFRAVGTGYLRFALEQPGQFQTAFSASSDLDSATCAARAGPAGLTPFQLLTQSLDDLVTVGLLPAGRRPAAEFLAWSAVHGLAELLIDGPLRALPAPVKQTLIVRVIDMVEQGL